jgi:hypothetical protein
LPADAFAIYNEKGEKVFLPGQFELAVGGGQPGTMVAGTAIPSLKAKVLLTSR